jgi:GntR family transcriptional regulator/MocR family aminotransferase
VYKSFPFSLELDRKSPVPLHKQIYNQIREQIRTGRLAPGGRLPPARQLAADWDVSRITTETAYNLLTAGGYVQRRTGSGTYVADDVPDTGLVVVPERQTRGESSALLSARAKALSAQKTPSPKHPLGTPFQTDLPELGTLQTSLRRLVARQLNRVDRLMVGYGDPAGLIDLRRAIADYITSHRGVRCSADQIVITSGAQQAINLCARLLLDPDDDAWVENPCYAPAVAALRSSGVNVVPVPVDAEGLIVQIGQEQSPAAKLAYVTPSRQYPLGVSMSMQRRKQLLEWATSRGSWIIEDDYDGDFRYQGKPLEALQGLDRNGRVIYVGTFSNVLFPALRIGYLALPEDLVDHFSTAKALIDRHVPSIGQAVLADFIAEGHFLAHVRRMRRTYAHRQSMLLKISREYWHDLLLVEPSTGGLFGVGWLKESRDDTEISWRAAERGISVRPVSNLYLTGQARMGLLLGFAAFSEEEMMDAATKLADIIRET